MKKGTSRHPKLLALAHTLNISRRDAAGLLEFLWEFAAEYAPAGDIGKHSDIDIALSVDWKGNPGELVGSLVQCRWLDECKTHRLLVHDWKDHCPAYLHKRVKRKELVFAVQSCPDKSGQREDMSGPSGLVYPGLVYPGQTSSGVPETPSTATHEIKPETDGVKRLSEIVPEILAGASRNAHKVPELKAITPKGDSVNA